MNKYKNKSNICGKVVKNHRLEKNWSLETLSNNLIFLDITLYPNDLFLIEKGQRIVKDFELIALCKVLQIDIYSVVDCF